MFSMNILFITANPGYQCVEDQNSILFLAFSQIFTIGPFRIKKSIVQRANKFLSL